MRQNVRRRRPRPRGVWLLLPVFITSACGDAGAADRPDDNALTIAVTTTVMGDVVRNVAPADAEITVLMEPGSDPHTFEPSARQLAALQEIDLVVASGGVEEGLGAALDEVQASGVPVFSALDHVTPLEGDDANTVADDSAHEAASDRSGEAGDEHGNDEAHDHGGVDPHFWMDPIRMAEAVEALGAELGELTGASRRSAARAERYGDELADLDGRISDLFDDLPASRRTIVSNHKTLAYFADRYDLRVAGTVIPSVSTGAEPSARDIDELATALRREGVTTILTDSTASTRLAETLAEEVGPGTQVVELYTESLGGDDGPRSYTDMLLIDADRIAQALQR